MFLVIITALHAMLFAGTIGGLTINTLEYQACKAKEFKGSVEVLSRFRNCKDLKRFNKYDKGVK